MIALSILLAISIALTFTFALLSDSRTATGTIQFSGSGSVVWSTRGALEADGNNVKFELDETDFDISANGSKGTLSAGVFSEEDFVTFTNSSKKVMYYKVSVNATALVGCTLTTNFKGGTGQIDKSGNPVTFTMDQILSGLELAITNVDEMKTARAIVITAEFKYDGTYTA